jgi:hypothetical protein
MTMNGKIRQEVICGKYGMSLLSQSGVWGEGVDIRNWQSQLKDEI